MSAYKE
ncbi:hypothetical protein VTL71DRAFT_14460 [Oculimacula yallundae]